MAARKSKPAASPRPKKSSARKPPAAPRPRKTHASVSDAASVPRAGELPVTRAMLGEVRTELLQRIDQAKEELRAEIHEVKAGLHGVQAGLHSVQAGLHSVQAEVARIGLLFEEQNARNKVVLDALVSIIDRQGRVEQRMDRVEDTVRSLASAHPAI